MQHFKCQFHKKTRRNCKTNKWNKCTGSDDLYQGVVALDYELQGHLGALDVLTNASVDLVNFATKDNVDVHANWLSETSRKLREFKTRGDVPTKVLIEAMVDSIAVRMSILEACRKHIPLLLPKRIFLTLVIAHYFHPRISTNAALHRSVLWTLAHR